MVWPLAMFWKYYLSTLTNLLVSWALMIECLTMLPKAVSTGVCVCVCVHVHVHVFVSVSVCERERAGLMTHIESLPSLRLSPWVDKHNHRTPTALNSALGDNLSLFCNWSGMALDNWVMTLWRKSLQKGSRFISQIKMINSLTNNATNWLNLSPLNVRIDHTFTTWFVSICCKHKLNQIMHWSCAWGEICHSFVDEDKLMSNSMSIEEQGILFFVFYDELQ